MGEPLWRVIAEQFRKNERNFEKINEEDLLERGNGISILKQQKQKPIKPIAPESDECCGNGCQRCVIEVYYEKLEQYEKDLQEWMEDE